VSLRWGSRWCGPTDSSNEDHIPVTRRAAASGWMDDSAPPDSGDAHTAVAPRPPPGLGAPSPTWIRNSIALVGGVAPERQNGQLSNICSGEGSIVPTVVLLTGRLSNGAHRCARRASSLAWREPRASPLHHPSESSADDLVSKYESGATTYELAEQFAVNRVTVTKTLERRSVPIRYQWLTSKQVVQAISLYARCLSLAKVGAELGCNHGTVRLALRAAGVKLRPRNGWKYD
jgi:hypothetical protein